MDDREARQLHHRLESVDGACIAAMDIAVRKDRFRATFVTLELVGLVFTVVNVFVIDSAIGRAVVALVGLLGVAMCVRRSQRANTLMEVTGWWHQALTERPPRSGKGDVDTSRD